MDRRFSLPTKVVLILIAVILPVFAIVTLLQHRFTRPLIEKELAHSGLTVARSLIADVVSERLLDSPDSSQLIEKRMRQLLYDQPSILRMDLVSSQKVIASSVEGEDMSLEGLERVHPEVPSFIKIEEDAGYPVVQILVPFKKNKYAQQPSWVRVLVSLSLVDTVMGLLATVVTFGAALSIILSVLTLSFFLRKAIRADHLLRVTQDQNVQLALQLHESQRRLMNHEKLAIMGQLTANFAHELGTPLNAVSGHLQLLKQELQPHHPSQPRLGIVLEQLLKIEKVVKDFLQTTAQSSSQKQLVDVNRMIDQALSLVRPKADSMGVDLQTKLDRQLGPVRAVPSDIEQVLLNLMTNSLDSLQSKFSQSPKLKRQLRVETHLSRRLDQHWCTISIKDTGIGIKKNEIKDVLKPFFTTKPHGQGTGLGLTISNDLVKKYGGELKIDSKAGHWTEVKIQIPFEVSV